MTFNEAAAKQFRHTSFYTVQLVKDNGSRVELGSTQRKSGAGLLYCIGSDRVQAIIRAEVPNADAITITKKTAKALHLSNGWRIEFGGTIRQEATE